MPDHRIFDVLGKLSSRKAAKYAVYLTAVGVFFALVLLPPIIGIIIKSDAIQQTIGRPLLTERAIGAIANSLLLALMVSAIDVIAGVPMAWLITRRKTKWLSALDTLADIPFIVPTSALGYSLLLFWSDPEGVSRLFGSSLVSPGWLLVILLHFTFSYPVVVRVIVGALLDYKKEYEQASRTLGAPPFTAARTVTFPILKPSLIAAFILSFARSLSETGATFIVAGAFENGPVFIQNMKDSFTNGLATQAEYEGATAFASLILIAISCTIFALIRIFGPRLGLPIRRIWHSVERDLSYSKAVTVRNSITLLVFAAMVLVPSLFVVLPAFQAVLTDTLLEAFTGAGVWNEYWQSLLLSYALGAIVTLFNVIIGLPMAILIARKKLGILTSTIMDILVNIPLIVPSIALGVSLRFFWKESLTFMPEMLLLILAHLAITYPYFVRSMSAAVERISVDMEEAARTLGAKPFGVFKTIVWPLTKYSILSGAIMVFTRSVSETGATVAVVTNLRTAPVVIVDWVKHKVQATPFEIGLGCGLLIIFSFIILFGLRIATRGKGEY